MEEDKRTDSSKAPIAKGGGDMLRMQSSAIVHGFGVSPRELSKLHVSGKHDECMAHLERMGGIRGLADKLATNLRTGIPGDTDDLAHRVEGYVGGAGPLPAQIGGLGGRARG